jgi:hypothetical protein
MVDPKALMADQYCGLAQNENGQTANQSNLSIQVGMTGQISNNFIVELEKMAKLSTEYSIL